MAVKNVYSKLGTKKHLGSSIHAGKAYHGLPFKEEEGLPKHRKNLHKRTSMIKKYLKVDGKYGIDLGCSVGGFVFDMQLAGAKMIGMDYDQESINVALSVEDKYKTGANFICSDINLASYKKALKEHANPETGKFDFCIWFSQFMWMVKAHGKEKSFKFLKYLSETCDVLFFETSQGDKQAGRLMRQMNISNAQSVGKLLRNRTTYVKVNNLGIAGDGWSKRSIFICKDNSKVVKKPQRVLTKSGVTSTVKINLDAKTVKKIYKKNYKHCQEFEVEALKKINEIDCVHFPKLISQKPGEIVISYAGDTLKKSKVPKDYQQQIKHIVNVLKKADIVHRDIRPDNIHFRNGKIIIIDFGWATSFKHRRTIPNRARGVGMSFKKPKDFDDEYSLNKSINHILKK